MNDETNDIKKEETEYNKITDTEPIIYSGSNDPTLKAGMTNNNKSSEQDNFRRLLLKQDWKKQLKKPYKKK